MKFKKGWSELKYRSRFGIKHGLSRIYIQDKIWIQIHILIWINPGWNWIYPIFNWINPGWNWIYPIWGAILFKSPIFKYWINPISPQIYPIKYWINPISPGFIQIKIWIWIHILSWMKLDHPYFNSDDQFYPGFASIF